ncbi:MAG: TIR domain-containing protein [Planctomycetes bacterium]|jgi:hypothetical protein|nr:TIR domain-containing protein [Planctomycetota bacterium]
MPKPRSRSTPLSIYVVFHPRSEKCRELAHSLHGWFRLAEDDSDRTEAGLPIWFRSQLTAGSPTNRRFSPPINWRDAGCNVVVVLCDRELVADPAYRHALDKLVEECMAQAPGSLVLPVEVHRCMHQLSFLTANRNCVRLDDVPGDSEEGLPVDDPRSRGRARQLRRVVTEAISRVLQSVSGAASSPERLKVFVSHAKGDGLPIAEKLRDSLAQFSQLQVWFDANDLPWGSEWSQPMLDAASGLAGLIAVVTDLYPTRPWCRVEATTARTPRLEGEFTAKSSVWKVQPCITVQHHGSKWSKAMAPLVHVPGIGWPDVADGKAVHDRIADVVDRFLLELLLASFYRRTATDTRELAVDLPDGWHLVVLTWVPEPWSLLQVIGEVQARMDAKMTLTDLVIAYPGHGLRTQEEVELQDLLKLCVPQSGPRAATPLRVHFRSQESFDPTTVALPTIAGTGVVCISSAGEDRELESAGVGTVHVSDFLLRLARRLLAAGWSLAYGGSLAPRYMNLTLSLIDAARGWVRAGNLKGDRHRSAAQLDQAPFVNYSPWPDAVPLNYRADFVGMARFERVLPPGFDDPDQLVDENPDTPRGRFLAAEAMGRMRFATSDPQRFPVRIVMAGKIAGSSGWLPGIAEEVLCALERGQLPVVLGGFGGCAGLLAGFLSDTAAEWPKQLTFDARFTDDKMKRMLEHNGAAEIIVKRFHSLREELHRFRSQLHEADGATWKGPVFDRVLLRELLLEAGPSVMLQKLMRLMASIKTMPAAPTG